MKAIIVNIGNELLNGSTLNTNGFWTAGQLHLLGIEVLEIKSIPDGLSALQNAIEQLPKQTDLVLLSGGLGPTPDDTTRMDIAQIFGLRLEERPELYTHIERMMGKTKASLYHQENKIQTFLPQGATILENKLGTAAGFSLKQNKVEFIFTPGVPFEMQHILSERVFPKLQGFANYKRELRTFGIGESLQTQLLSDIKTPAGLIFASLPGQTDLLLRVTGSLQQKKLIDAHFAEICLALENYQDHWISIDGLPLLGTILEGLKEKNQTLAVAESCTGGLLGSWLSSLSGSSQVFAGGWITYTNELKMQELEVKVTTLEKHGAVSEACVFEMADGARNKAKTHFALAISGIAGPTGGTKEKPVGTVCFALSSEGGTQTETLCFKGNRDRIRQRAAAHALFMLFKILYK